MSEDNPYAALAEDHDDGADRWGFGTAFDETRTGALAGMDAPPPSGVAGADLALYCQMLGDDALVLAQRLIQWCTDAPELEEEVALANIALDLLGQARFLLARAGQADGTGRDEDAFAYLRPPREFRNVRLAELPNGDFAQSTVRLLAFSTWRLALCTRLARLADPVLAGVAGKAVKEITYHREYATEWTLRLGDGTAHSHQRMTEGLAVVWPTLGELFATHEVEARLAAQGVAVHPAGLRAEVEQVLGRVLEAATLPIPGPLPEGAVAGRAGHHTAEFAPLVAELQRVARAHPGASW